MEQFEDAEEVPREKAEFVMDDTTILTDNVEVVEAARPQSRAAISWSAAIAGALVAFAVSFLIFALGSGVGLAVASPYASGPSAATLTIAGAIWLVLAQSIGYATGGYVAGRMRVHPPFIPGEGTGWAHENRFRDGAHGFLAWAIGVVVLTIMVFAVTGATIATAPRAGAMLGAAVAGGSATAGAEGAAPAQAADPLAYYVDALLRANPPHQATAGVPRDQVERILARAVAQGRLADDDRAYLGEVVASETGLSAPDASRRVDEVVNQARENARQVADTARQAAAYLSFWMFLSLLFGALAGTLGGMLGGELRDEGMHPSLVATR